MTGQKFWHQCPSGYHAQNTFRVNRAPSTTPAASFNSLQFLFSLWINLRLVFTSDGVGVGVGVGVVIRRSWSSENQIVGVESRSRKTKPITERGNVLCDWFILLLLLPTPTICWFSLDHKCNVSDEVGRNGNVVILLTPIPSRLKLRLRLLFLIFTGS